jgi:hypothetical protein
MRRAVHRQSFRFPQFSKATVIQMRHISLGFVFLSATVGFEFDASRLIYARPAVKVWSTPRDVTPP